MKTSIIALASATTLLVGATWATRLLAPSPAAAFEHQGNDSDDARKIATDAEGSIHVPTICATPNNRRTSG